MNKDKVLYRVFPETEHCNREVIALFPEMIEGPDLINSYAHIGQHSAASPELIDDLDPATKEEYADLEKELKIVGYNI